MHTHLPVDTDRAQRAEHKNRTQDLTGPRSAMISCIAQDPPMEKTGIAPGFSPWTLFWTLTVYPRTLAHPSLTESTMYCALLPFYSLKSDNLDYHHSCTCSCPGLLLYKRLMPHNNKMQNRLKMQSFTSSDLITSSKLPKSR